MTSISAKPDLENAKKSAQWPIFAVACGAVFLVSLDTTMLYSVFATLQTAFRTASSADLSWVINAYTIVYAASLIPAGGFSDTYGRKNVFLLGVLLFIAASAACGGATDVPFLILARVFQALGAAMLTPASLSIVLAAFPTSKRALTVSLWGAVGGFAAALGPSLGAYVAQTSSWRWAFFINVPIGALSLAFGVRLLSASSSAKPLTASRRIDIVGMSLLVLAVSSLALALVELPSPRWTAMILIAVFGISGAAMTAFVIWANWARDPLVDLKLFRNPTYSAVNVATLTFGIAFAMMFFAFFFYMTRIWHFDQIHAGLAIVPGPLTVIPVAIATGRLAGRFGHRPFLVGGALLYACTGLWYYLVPGIEPAYASRWLPGLIMSGVSVGLVMPSLAGAAVSKLPVEHYAVGSAVNQATRQMGTVIGVSLVVMLLGHGFVDRSAFDKVYGIHISLALVTAFFSAFVRTRRN